MSEQQVGETSIENKEKPFMKKAEREICWGARDKLYACMRKYDENETNLHACIELRKDYIEACPPTWVTAFDRKFHYENKKKKLLKNQI